MTGPGAVVDRDPVESPVRPRSRVRPVIALVVVVLVVGLAVVGVARHTGHRSQPQRRGQAGAGLGQSAERKQSAAHAAMAVLDRRATAVRHHDRAEFAATLDPDRAGFRRAQLAMFGNLARVRFAAWSYQLGAGVRQLPAAARYQAPTYAPGSATLHYRLAGFDRSPIGRVQYPTFVERSGRWYLASLSDFRAQGAGSATDLWDYGPVTVVRRPDVLVLGPPSQRRTMAQIASASVAAIPRVTAVWGADWSRRVVVLVPRTETEMARIDQNTGDHRDLSQIAAQTSAEISSAPGRPQPTGGRVTINPATWPELDALGRSVVLTHELTHVATESVSGAQQPRWLQEGFADYVGFQQPGVTVAAAARELQAAVRAGHLPRALPADRDFNWGGSRLAQAYEQGWLACRYIAARDGQAALVRLYRVVGTSHLGTTAAVAQGLRTVLGLTTAQFTADWRRYVARELSA